MTSIRNLQNCLSIGTESDRMTHIGVIFLLVTMALVTALRGPLKSSVNTRSVASCCNSSQIRVQLVSAISHYLDTKMTY